MTQLDAEALEAAARAMCERGGFDPDEIMANDGPRWRYYVPGVESAVRAYRYAREAQGFVEAPRTTTELDEGVLAEACDRAWHDCGTLLPHVAPSVFNIFGRHMARHIPDVAREFSASQVTGEG